MAKSLIINMDRMLKPFDKIDEFLTKYKSSPICVVFTPRLTDDDGNVHPIKAVDTVKVLKIYNKFKKENTPEFHRMNGHMLSDYTLVGKNIKVIVDFSMIDDSFSIEHVISPDDDGNYPINDNLIGFPNKFTLSVCQNKNMGEKKQPKKVVDASKKPTSPNASKPSKASKEKHVEKILNEKTGRMVLKTGKIGKQILAGKL